MDLPGHLRPFRLPPSLFRVRTSDSPTVPSAHRWIGRSAGPRRRTGPWASSRSPKARRYHPWGRGLGIRTGCGRRKSSSTEQVTLSMRSRVVTWAASGRKSAKAVFWSCLSNEIFCNLGGLHKAGRPFGESEWEIHRKAQSESRRTICLP